MKWLARAMWFPMLPLAVLLSACTRNVAWDEEVPLNTGDVLVVHRTVQYEIRGAPGNPLDIGWGTKPGATLKFAWKGRQFAFASHDRPLLLAISPSGTPVLIADADAGRWDKEHGYACTTPHYVQFVPDPSGSRWTWPATMEPWLYGLPANLLRNYPTPGNVQARFAAPEVSYANASLGPPPRQERAVDSHYVSVNCQRKAKAR
jgi:hypothetical protein